MNRGIAIVIVTALSVVMAACGRYRDKPACADAVAAGDWGAFQVRDGGLAIDRESGLTWYRCQAGEQFRGNQCQGDAQLLGLKEARAFVAEVSQASGKQWRLPTVDEMKTLRLDQCENPSVNPNVFPSVYSDSYWNDGGGSHGELLGCSTNTFNGNSFCREYVEHKRPFLMVLDSAK